MPLLPAKTSILVLFFFLSDLSLVSSSLGIFLEDSFKNSLLNPSQDKALVTAKATS